jgi:hypothetical protein
MVLEGDQVQSGLFGDDGKADDRGGRRGSRGDEGPELDRAAKHPHRAGLLAGAVLNRPRRRPPFARRDRRAAGSLDQIDSEVRREVDEATAAARAGAEPAADLVHTHLWASGGSSWRN